MRTYLIMLLLVILVDAACDSAKKTQVIAKPKVSKAELSNVKLAKLITLMEQLEKKRSKLDETLTTFHQQIHKWKQQVESEIRWREIHNFTEATNNKLISNNLEAIRKAEGYQQIVQSEIDLTKAALMEADRVRKQVELDVLLLDSLEENKLTTIVESLDFAIDNLQLRSTEMIINPNNADLPSLESIWQKHFNAK